jgi:protein-disulfide isomerase
MKKILFANKGKIKKEILFILSFTIIALIASVVVLITLNNGNDLNNKATATSSDVSIHTTNINHIKGMEDASVSLVEYSDLQCPACGVYYPVVKQIMKEFGDSMSFEYRHFPLRTIHQNAESAALATEAAGLQGKFWEMHDILFERQKEWSNKKGKNIFTIYAEEIGVDSLKFESDMLLNEDIKNKVENDFQSGLALSVNSTPSFFLNGVKMQNPRSYEEFRSIIQQFIFAQ